MFSTSGSSSRSRTSRDHPADDEPDRDPARRLPEELPARVQQREARAGGGRERDPVGHERGRVVDQRLALEHAHERAAARRAGGRSRSPPRGRSARRSRRARTPRATRARRSARAPPTRRRAPSRSPARSRAARSAAGSSRRSRRLAKNAPEYSSGGRKSTSTRSGSSCTSGSPGIRPEHRPADHEHDRVRDVDRARRGGQHDHRDEQRDEDYFDVVHRTDAVVLDLGHLAALDQQVDVAEHLATA